MVCKVKPEVVWTPMPPFETFAEEALYWQRYLTTHDAPDTGWQMAPHLSRVAKPAVHKTKPSRKQSRRSSRSAAYRR